MNKLLTLVTLTFLAGAIHAQQNINAFVKLDTIFSTGIVIDNADVTTKSVIARILGNEAWIYYPNWKENDSIHFLKINLLTHKKEQVNIHMPGISFKVSSPFISDFAITKNALVILFASHSFAYFKNTKAGYAFKFIEPVQGSFSGIHLLPEDRVLIYNNYNSHPMDNPDKTIFHVYDCKSHKLLYTSRPHFNAVQFCHFSPNQWLDVSSKNVVFSQTTSYALSFFDFKLEKVGSFKSTGNGWVYADTNRIKALESVKPALSAKDFIDRLSPVEDTVSRIEAVYFLNATKLLVRKIPAYAKKQNRLRTYDLLVLNEKTNTWERTRQDIRDVIVDPAALCTKRDFPVNSVYYNVLFSEKYFIKLLPRFTPFVFNKTFQENKDNEEKALGKVNPEMYIQIFKVDFN